MSNRRKEGSLLKTQKWIDGDKVKAYIKEHRIVQQDITEKIDVSHGYIRQAANRGYTNIGMWRLVCAELGLPEDYFDAKKPEPEPVKEEPKEDCGVDLSDIQYSLNILESFMNKLCMIAPLV